MNAIILERMLAVMWRLLAPHRRFLGVVYTPGLLEMSVRNTRYALKAFFEHVHDCPGRIPGKVLASNGVIVCAPGAKIFYPQHAFAWLHIRYLGKRFAHALRAAVEYGVNPSKIVIRELCEHAHDRRIMQEAGGEFEITLYEFFISLKWMRQMGEPMCMCGYVLINGILWVIDAHGGWPIK